MPKKLRGYCTCVKTTSDAATEDSAGNNVKNTGLHIHLDSIIMSNIC